MRYFTLLMIVIEIYLMKKNGLILMLKNSNMQNVQLAQIN